MKYALLAAMALMVVGSVAAAPFSASTTMDTQPTAVKSTSGNVHQGTQPQDNDNPRDSNGNGGGCSLYEWRTVNGQQTPACIERDRSKDDMFWVLHSFLISKNEK